MRAIKQMLQGKDKEWSLRRVIAFAMSLGIVFIATYGTIVNQDTQATLAVLAAYGSAMLGLTTYQNTKPDPNNQQDEIQR